MKSLAKERAKAVKESDSAKVKALRVRVREIQRLIIEAKRRHPRERRALLLEIKGMTKAMRAAEREERGRLARKVAQAVAEFRSWWAEVMKERKRRLDEIRELREEIRRHQKASRARVQEFTAIMSKRRDESIDDLEERHNREADDLHSKLNRAKRELKSEIYDQRQMRHTAKAIKPTVKASERRQEFTGGVEANLGNAIELAVWKKARKQILAEAKRKRVTASDGVAELVREYAEQHADQAYGWLQADVEKWMAGELERKGYAA